MRIMARISAIVGLLLAATAHAGFVNGDFEDAPDFTGWTKESYTNNGIPKIGGAFVTPTSEASLNLTPGGASNLWSVQRGATDGLSDSNTNDVIKFPHWGGAAALLNDGGNNNKANGIRQTATVTYAGDADPDGKIHIRFAAAPVMQDASHPADQQPYFFIQVKNVDTGKILFTTFNFANEPGFTWQTGVGQYKYTDWQTFDVPLATADVADGAKLEFYAVAAGCSQGGHEGHLYLDLVTTKLAPAAGLWVAATEPVGTIRQPTEADGSTLITYTYTYQNVTGSVPAAGVVLNLPMPKGSDGVTATFESLGGANASVCTAPAVGATTPMVCNVGAMNGGDSGTFTMTVRVPATTTATSVNNASYTIAATGVPTLLGTPVKTTLLPNMVPDVSKVPTSMPYGQPLPVGAQFSCKNEGATAAVNARCTISNLPGGVTAGQCKLDGVNWTGPAAVPVGKTVVCPLSGTPNNPADVGTKKAITVTGNADNADPSLAGAGKAVLVAAAGVLVGTAAPASIPTLSEWGLIILSALVGLFTLGLRRRTVH